MNNLNPQNTALLQRQCKTAQYTLLATVVATLVNVALLLAEADLFIPYCAALPYYLIFLGFYFDGYVLSTFTLTGMVMAFVALAVWLLVWWMSRDRCRWLKAGMILVIVDTVILAIFAFVFLEDPSSCLWEGLMHLAVIYELYVGVSACKQLQSPPAPDPAPQWDPWDPGTPSDSEYSNDYDD